MNKNRIDYIYSEMKRNYLSYKNSYNKEYVRCLMSKMLEKEIIDKGRKLNYLGMSSLYFFDVQQWKEYIKNITCIEIEKVIFDKQKQIFDSLQLSNINLKIINNDIDDYDAYKNLLDNTYDLIYLDYWDDLISNIVNRITVIKKYIKMQVDGNLNSFVLALNCSFTPGNELYYKKVLHLDKEYSFYKICDVINVADIICEKIKEYCFSYNYGIKTSDFVLYRQRNDVIRINYSLHVYKNYIGDTERNTWQEIKKNVFFKY